LHKWKISHKKKLVGNQYYANDPTLLFPNNEKGAMIQKNWTPPWTFESKTKKKTEMICSKWWPTSTRIGITLMCTWCKVVELEKIHKPAMSSTSSRLTICTPPFRPFLKVPKPLPPANIWLFTTSCTASPHYLTYFALLLLILVLFIVQTNQVQENWPNQSRQSPWTWPAWQDNQVCTKNCKSPLCYQGRHPSEPWVFLLQKIPLHPWARSHQTCSSIWHPGPLTHIGSTGHEKFGWSA